jgi:hypothetical protein
MTTLETKALVTFDHKLTIEVPPEVQPGEHRIVLMIDDGVTARAKEPPLDFPSYPAGPVDEGFTFRREDLYGPDGR